MSSLGPEQALAWLTRQLEAALGSRKLRGIMHPNPDVEARALLAWSNVVPPVPMRTLDMLKTMAVRGLFTFWDCPECKGTVLVANDSELPFWKQPNQRDTLAHPLESPDDKRCDHCRCFRVKNGKRADGSKVSQENSLE